MARPLILERLETRRVLTAPTIDSMDVSESSIYEGDPAVVVSGEFTNPVTADQGVDVGLDPNDFVSLGAFDPTATVVIDTSTLSMTGGATAIGVDSGGTAVFTFDSITVGAGILITASGERPFALLSQSGVTIDGVIDASAVASEPGPGGGAGATVVGSAGAAAVGAPANGAGQGAPGDRGGGGGAHGGNGGTSNGPSGSVGAQGGVAYGDLEAALTGGSGGGSGGSADNGVRIGGGGGGGVEIGAYNSVAINGSVLVDGASGGIGGISNRTGGGGGAGGGVFIHGADVVLSGTVSASGGDAGNAIRAGGGGGGGRVLIAHNLLGSFTQTGTIGVAGGANGSGPGSTAGGIGVTTVIARPGRGGSPGTLTGAAVWSDGLATTLNIDAEKGTFSTSRKFADDNPTGTPSDEFTVEITISNDDGSDKETSSVITVANVEPVIEDLTVTGLGVWDNKARPGDEITLTALLYDVGVLDQHTVIVDWGASATPGDPLDTSDSSDPLDSSITCGCESNGSGALKATHTYDTGGIYTITVTLIDDDTGMAVDDSTEVFVSGVRVDPNTDELQVVGTAGKDVVVVTKVVRGDEAKIKVYANLNARRKSGGEFFVFDADDITSIHIVLCAGHDYANVGAWGPALRKPALIEGNGGNDRLIGGAAADVILGGAGEDRLSGRGGDDLVDGGAGKDQIYGGTGADVLLGGDGKDLLLGGRGNDILIGGGGTDFLLGGRGNDILIGAVVNLDYSMLRDVRDIWTNDASYDSRVAALTGDGGLLEANVNVIDDDAEDSLTGNRGRDLFFAKLTGGHRDRVLGRRGDEELFLLD